MNAEFVVSHGHIHCIPVLVYAVYNKFLQEYELQRLLSVSALSHFSAFTFVWIFDSLMEIEQG